MKKRMIVFTLGIVLFMAGSFDSAAAVCPNSPDDVHHLTKHSPYSTYDTPGQHNYLWGYDSTGKEIILVCHTDMHWTNCKYICEYCNASDPTNSTHTHYDGSTHYDCGK